MLYTIGLSFSAELLIKGFYENTIGRAFEWIGGWDSADDRYAAKVQQRYGAFMHETPWYEFPFGEALANLWGTNEPKRHVRHWERRFALSGEYGVKTGYAKLIGAASGASLGRDERTLRIVARARAGQLERIDPRFKTVGRTPSGVLVEAPRYAQFTDLLSKLSRTPVQLVEISGNDDIFVTALVPDEGAPGTRREADHGHALGRSSRVAARRPVDQGACPAPADALDPQIGRPSRARLRLLSLSRLPARSARTSCC